MTDEPRTTAAVDTILERFFDQRIERAASFGPQYRLLWERVRIAVTGGKRIRPRLLLLAHDAFDGQVHDDAFTAAAAFELLHTALLLHDDVLDGDLVRRGRPNLPGTFVSDALDIGVAPDAATGWGEAAAVLAGDLLISAVHALISRLPAPGATEIHEIVDESLFATAAGELADIGFAAGTVPADVAGITGMMAQKTAAYSFAGPLRAGAKLARAGAAADAELAEIGGMLGFIYQLRDDLLGVFGNPHELGKSVDGDLREGKRTLLIAHAEGTEEWQGVEHLFGRRSLDADDAQRLRDALTSSGARFRTELLLTTHCQKTRSRIQASRLPAVLIEQLADLARRSAERDS